MDAPPRNSCGSPGAAYSEDAVRGSRLQIVKACVFAGLDRADAEDLAQDLWMWMVRAAVPAELIPTPWFRGVIHNYILRYRRRTYCRDTREGPLENAPEPRSPEAFGALESRNLLDRISAGLPELERSLLTLIRSGHSLAEAARQLGIPPGSRDYYHGRLIASARRFIRRATLELRAR